jgi:Ni/Fe-hydrogenase subunit HybB-like protein
VRVAAVLTVVGIVLNRLNVAVIALGWRADPVYTPSFAEVTTSVVIVATGIVVFRWFVRHMPILDEPMALKWQH